MAPIRSGLIACVCACVFPLSAQAARPGTPPPALDPSQTLDQREREQRSYEPRKEDRGGGVEIEKPSGRFALPEGGGELFVLKGVEVSASEFIDQSRLQKLAGMYIGREVTFADVNDLVRSINNIYKELGQITARAIVPSQRIQQGIIRIQLIEGRLGRVELNGLVYTDAEFVRGLVPVDTGDVIDVPALKYRIEAANRLLPFRLGAQLQAGDGFAQTDVVVGVQEPPRFIGQLFIDNNGSESTGEIQYGAQATVNGPLGRGDRLNVYAVESEGASSLNLTYAVPHRATGGVLSINLAGSETEIIGGDFAEFDITGDSTQMSLEYTAPVATWDTAALDSVLRIGSLESGNEIGSLQLSENRVERIGIGARIHGRAAFPRWTVEPELLFESTDLNRNEQKSTYRFNGAFSRSGPGVYGSYLQIRGRWQYTQDRQPSPLQFSAGGTGSVRGFKGGVVSGDRGLSASAELHWAPAWAAVDWVDNIFTFFDFGYVDGVGTASEHIQALGGGVRVSYASATFTATAGIPVGATHGVEHDDYAVHARIAYRFGGN